MANVGDKSKPLVLTKRVLKPAEKRVLKKLSGQVNEIKGRIDEERLYRDLNPEDNPVRRAPSAKQIQESKRREEGLRTQLRTTTRMISKVKGGALLQKSLFKAPPTRGGGSFRAAIEKWKDLFDM